MEKILSEVVAIPSLINTNNKTLEYPTVEKYLKDGWTIKNIFHQAHYIDSKTGPSDIILTVHLIKGK